ncbi:DUF1176 domain-containing protein [Sphingomonas sp. PB2P12]|uniref:DUF1176 domain-containing protein n=1 Tax=Sphingomonas sandaracina TaxID=3096157 RepID=UPI002FC82177
MQNPALLPLAMIAAALAGCSPPSQPAARETPKASALPPSKTAAEPTAVADTHTPPKPGKLKTFGDWTAGCDNALRCTLGALLPEAGFPAASGDRPITLNITREAGPAGALSVKVETNDDAATQPTAPASFAVDDKPIAAHDAAALATAMANGTALAIRAANGRTLATLSLKGAAAALRYIDAEQGRAGSTDAIVAKGPAASAAPRPALPVITAVTPSGIPATLTRRQISQIRTQAQCDLPDAASGMSDETFAPDTYALGGGKTLVILPCSTGAYNMISALFVVDGAKITPASIDAPAGFEATGADTRTPVHSIVNGRFADGVLTSDAKGRGLGDCGVHQSFVWDGNRLRLSEQSEMGECRGNIDFITTWRAKVVR